MTNPTRSPESLWLDGVGAPVRPALDGDLSVDVAVIGGGIVGLTTALLLKRGGASVAVVEAGRIGHGVTGHSTAKVSSLHGLVYGEITARFGERAARIYGEANEAAIERIAGFVEEERIDCDFERAPAFVYTESQGEADALRQEAAIARGLGLPASYVEEVELPWGPPAALRFDRQAQFDPYRYLLALAAAVPGEGSHVLEGTRALAVTEDEPCRVRTATGSIVAGDVIVATHLPFLDRGAFFARTHPERSYVLGVRVDPRAEVEGMYLSTESPAHTVRRVQARAGRRGGMLLVGGEGHKVGQGGDTAERVRRLEAWARARFPVREVEHRWSSQDNMPIDGLPFVGLFTPLSTRLYTATGMRKWGITNGTAAAMILSDSILKRPNLWSEVFDARRVKPLASASSFVRENVNVGRRFVADRLVRPRRDPASEMGPGEAAVLRDGARSVAVSRADDGSVSAVSAVCPHLGCLVRWNSAETSWDCPCHGSRFDREGRLLQGPAVRDLDSVELS
ncbi:MAG: FAD-dependent oxidoreductase [Thermoleophilaceae bacterium]